MQPPAACTASVTRRQPAICVLGMNSGGAAVALAVPARLGALGDDHAGRRALAVVGDGKIARDVARERTVARHGRHEDAVAQVQAPELQGLQAVLSSRSSSAHPDLRFGRAASHRFKEFSERGRRCHLGQLCAGGSAQNSFHDGHNSCNVPSYGSRPGQRIFMAPSGGLLRSVAYQ